MRTLYILLIFCTTSTHLLAKANVDSLFNVARELAFSGEYFAARSLCDSILEQAPNYTDVHILKGRTYAWENNTDEARVELLKAINAEIPNEDAYVALSDNELWAGYYGRAENYAEQGLTKFPGSVVLFVKLAQIQYNMAKYHPALGSVDSALVVEPQNETALKLREDILDMLKQDKIKVQHSIEWFSTPYSNVLNITSIEYIKNIKKLIVIPRLSYGKQKLDSLTYTGVQAELDAYYQLTPITSVYFNYGYGFTDVFPRHRHGLEVFQRLPQGFEASLGYRLLYYENSLNGNLTDIYTGSISKYWKSFWFSFRPYIAPSSSGINSSYYLFGRYYYKTSDDFVELSLGSGFSADESVFAQMNSTRTTYLNSYRVGLRAQYRYKRLCILHAGAAMRIDEYFQKKTRPVYYLTAGISFFL